MIVDDGYCDVATRPDSERPCWPANCPEHIPTSPTAAAVATEAVAADITAYWRTGTWGQVMTVLFLYGIILARVTCNAD